MCAVMFLGVVWVLDLYCYLVLMFRFVVLGL